MIPTNLLSIWLAQLPWAVPYYETDMARDPRTYAVQAGAYKLLSELEEASGKPWSRRVASC